MAVLFGDLQRNGQSHLTEVFQGDLDALCAIVLYIPDPFYALVECPGGKEPLFPEPGQVVARGIVHRPEEIIGLWMFEGPTRDICLERIVEPVGAEHFTAQDIQGDGCLNIIEAY